jgi:hypothetical protein
MSTSATASSEIDAKRLWNNAVQFKLQAAASSDQSTAEEALGPAQDNFSKTILQLFPAEILKCYGSGGLGAEVPCSKLGDGDGEPWKDPKFVDKVFENIAKVTHALLTKTNRSYRQVISAVTMSASVLAPEKMPSLGNFGVGFEDAGSMSVGVVSKLDPADINSIILESDIESDGEVRLLVSFVLDGRLCVKYHYPSTMSKFKALNQLHALYSVPP